MAYFSEKVELTEMVDHIYGRTNVMTRTDRPHMFIKELSIYIDYLIDLIKEFQMSATTSDKQQKYILTFASNLKEGIGYYQNLISTQLNFFNSSKDQISNQLHKATHTLDELVLAFNPMEV